MQKILIIGCAGAGKSNLSRRLAQKLTIPVVHLDREFWRSGWKMPTREEWLATLAELVKKEMWILDGNFDSSLDLRLEFADTLIYLDFPTSLCLWRVLKRRLKYRNIHRPDMSAGCNERLDLDFLKWIWRFKKDSAPSIESCLARFAGKRNIIVLRSSSEVANFVQNLSEA